MVGMSRRRRSSRDPERSITGLPGVMMAMARNAAGAEVHVANPREKRAVEVLEKKGLVSVRRTKDRIAGLTEWWFRATPKGLGSRDTRRDLGSGDYTVQYETGSLSRGTHRFHRTRYASRRAAYEKAASASEKLPGYHIVVSRKGREIASFYNGIKR